ncbi:DNA repair protein RadC [Sedimentibacter sp. zth1]|uniref:RadC family protein n=1 Tax=Sedimentibacter sp. zth1 TaxID=2816908 RepID=UPI001A922511|nr:DNA repair protein RadC [Sedimentibacter sp. zth1]QSX06208.1 DNA repair protein RadC [Sedimentibacter sp. zth1]
MQGNYTISKIPKEERPREKLLKHGASVLTNSELLALIVGVGSKEDSAITLSQKILNNNNNGLHNLVELDAIALKSYKGINDAKAAKILAVVEISKRISRLKINKVKISSPESVAVLLLEEMRYLKKEYFKVALLDTKNNILAIKDISMGCLDSTVVHPREVFVEAIKLSSASIILVHNHPSGEVEPSKEDKNITNRIIECGKIIGIRVLDHIIIGDGIFLSFKEHGYM